MSTLVNGCTYFHEIDWKTYPRVLPNWKTEVAESLDGPQDRLGLRNDPLVRQTWRMQVLGVAERTELESRKRETEQSGRACAPRWDRALPVTANSGTSLTVLSAWTLAIGDFIAVPTSAGLVVREISGAVESPAGTWTLTLTATVTAQIDMLAYPLIFGTPRIERLRSLNSRIIDFEITITEPLGTGSRLNSDSCTPAALTAETVVSFCQNSVAVDDPPDCAAASIARLTLTEPWSQATDYTLEGADAADGPWTELDSGITTYWDAPRSQTVRYYRLVPQVNGIGSDPSEVAICPSTTIEGVMRAVQERFLAVESPASPIVWPDRVSDSASPGDYPAENFYTDKGTAASAVVYVQAIAEAFNAPPASWLDKYTSESDLTDIADIASIPLHDTTTLMVPATASINTGNWEDKLFELAGCCCRLENLLYTATVTEEEERYGYGYGFKYNLVSEQESDVSYGACLSAAYQAWNIAIWEAPGGFYSVAGVEVPNAYGYDNGPGQDYGLVAPGLGAIAGVKDGNDSSYEQWYGVSVSSRRAKITADLTGSSLGTATLYLGLSGTTDTLPMPVSVLDSLQPWPAPAIMPGVAGVTGYLTGTNGPSPTPPGFGGIAITDNIHHSPDTWPELVSGEGHWSLQEQIVLWRRSHLRASAEWTHYP